MLKWKMCRQSDTLWVSEDNTCVFSVDSSGRVTGTIQTNTDAVQVYVVEGVSADTTIYIFPIEFLENEHYPAYEYYEIWSCNYKSDKKFVITARETTFFQEGEKIVFHRQD